MFPATGDAKILGNCKYVMSLFHLTRIRHVLCKHFLVILFRVVLHSRSAGNTDVCVFAISNAVWIVHNAMIFCAKGPCSSGRSMLKAYN